MRYKGFICEYKGQKVKYTNLKEINKILKDNKCEWLIECEFENADIEIKNNTIIWESGDFISGEWVYGIFKDGTFGGLKDDKDSKTKSAIWINGIWESGRFNGRESGKRVVS